MPFSRHVVAAAALTDMDLSPATTAVTRKVHGPITTV